MNKSEGVHPESEVEHRGRRRTMIDDLLNRITREVGGPFVLEERARWTMSLFFTTIVCLL